MKHGEIDIRFRCSGMPHSSIQMLGKPAIGEILHAGQKLENAVEKFAVKVVRNNETSKVNINRLKELLESKTRR